MFAKIKPLTVTIHRNKRMNFASERVYALSGAPMTVAQLEKSELAALVDLAEGSGMIQLETVFEGRVTDECLSLCNIDGSMRKTVKSKLFELLNLNPVTVEPRDHVSLVDMELIWWLATPTYKDRLELSF